MLKTNEGTRGYTVRFICAICRYEQVAYINVKPESFKTSLGAKFICNECQSKPVEFMDGNYRGTSVK